MMSEQSLTYLCRWCGGLHVGICPRVKAIECDANGVVRRIEFHDWSFQGRATVAKLEDFEQATKAAGWQ